MKETITDAVATTELILVRHGETAWNLEGRMQGHLDVPLNPLGLLQAEAICKRFASERLDAIYSSDLERALKTVQPLAQHGVTIEREPRLRERHYGVLQGLTSNEAAALHGPLWDKYRARHPDVVLAGGETLREFSQRVIDVISELGRRHRGQRVLLATHGGVLDVAYRHATAMPLDGPRNFPIRNASVNVLLHRDQHWQVANWGDVSHLPVQALDDA